MSDHERDLLRMQLTAVRLAGIGLVNGGMAGLVWDYFLSWVGFTFINISMAEMGSMQVLCI